MKQPVLPVCVSFLTAILIFGAPAAGQMPSAEHEQHHPQPGPADSARAGHAPGMTSGEGMGGSMGGMGRGMGEMGGNGGEMGGMMKQMGVPPRKELYPTLMNLPADLTPEQRTEVERLAHERMETGSALMSSGLEALSGSASGENYRAMQEATVQLRQGIMQFESGLAAHRALSEGTTPQNVALDWFKRDMSLLPAVDIQNPHGLFGLSWFHYLTMFILLAFSCTMIAISFHKMRRAESLVARLAGGATDTIQAANQASHGAGTAATVSPSPPRVDTALSLQPETAPSKPNSWSGLLRVVRIFDETPNVKTLRLAEQSGGELPFRYLPGQFVTFTVRPIDQRVKRSYTIASSPTRREYCEVTVKREERGTVSNYLHNAHQGDTLYTTGPSGKFTFTGEETNSIVLISGGVGITPMMSALRYLTDRSWSGDIFFIFACRGEKDVIFREELEYLSRRHPNLHLTITASDIESEHWPYARGRITKELLAQTVPQLTTRRIHICGPGPMMEAVKGILAELGVLPEQIRTEVFIGKERPLAPATTLPEDRAATPVGRAEPPAGAAAPLAVITFARSKKTAMLPPEKSILEASEDVGVNIDYSCRVGTCGACKTKLLSGSVTMAVQDGLDPGDKENNIILACQAKSTGDVSVDAYVPRDQVKDAGPTGL